MGMTPARPHVLLVEDDTDTREVPRFSGAQFRARRLANPDTSDVPLILVSAVADLESHAQALRAFARLQKPIDPDQLVSFARRAPNTSAAARASREPDFIAG
jgi:CheY-like chemotaxis protein